MAKSRRSAQPTVRTTRGLRVLLPTLILTVSAVTALLSATPAQASAPPMCIPVRATGVGQDLGPDSQGNLHTTATISVGGVTVGNTDATFTPSGPVAGGQLDFSGPIVFTPGSHGGTSATRLTATVQGGVDLSTGSFVASSTAVTGTGLLAAVTGELTFRGTENLATGAFSESVIGRLCASTA